MRTAKQVAFTLALILIGAGFAGVHADTDEVWDYATRCYSRLGIQAADLPNTFKCMDYVDENNGVATQLFTTQYDATRTPAEEVKRDIEIYGVANADKLNNFPEDQTPAQKCDRPAWLALSTRNCYGNTYIQPILVTGKPDILGAFICRHKKTWSNADTDFSDIAMILHNKKNGQTCWFQSRDDAANLDGRAVLRPDRATDHTFWHKPSTTAGIKCVRCHDNGPWMNSRWLDHNTTTAFKDHRGAYLNEGIHFNDWVKPTYVTVGDSGLPADKTSCTGCHKIAAKDKFPDGKEFQNCDKWINYTVGRDFHDKTNAHGREFDLAYWMPENHGLADAAAWKTAYKEHVDRIVACCKVKGNKGLLPAGTKWADDCAEYKPKALSAAPPGPGGVRIYASATNGGNTTNHLCTDSMSCPPISIAAGTTLTVGWDADANYDLCTIEATYPAGVRSYPAGQPQGVGTATNWSLDDSYPAPVEMGELTAPGQYTFRISCDPPYAPDPPVGTLLTFEIAGTPASLMTLQVIDDGNPSEAAASDGRADHVAVTVAPGSSTVDLTWFASNVVSESCVVTEEIPPGQPTGSTWTDPTGILPISVGLNVQQKYTLACTDPSGPISPIDVTIQRLPGRKVRRQEVAP